MIYYKLFTYARCREEGDLNQAVGFLSKAITADPKDIQLRFLFASLYLEHGNYQIAARTYYQIHQISPENVEALKIAAQVSLVVSFIYLHIHIYIYLSFSIVIFE